ncbi:HEAT repeat domain-containing protein [Rubrivirga marina]|uniref:HEAT repeat domain-containing protein n=1 Tax=Rubrivirga marina TaxID=1196024 RepID=A0A271IYK0_9BACT|nr:HEAT repeat domain-containing protein [Rubrivirga marina]PAP75599.1 hypothetical protein BSZ37_03685 [Rubrivirga marina]
MRLPLTAALAVCTLVGAAHAQPDTFPRSTFLGAAPFAGTPDAPLRVSAAVVEALESPSDRVRTDALHAVATLGFVEGADIRPAVPALLSVYRTDADERLRVMALRALEASGDEAAMAALRAEVEAEVEQRGHPNVRRLLAAVLVDHYGTYALRHDPALMGLIEGALTERTP